MSKTDADLHKLVRDYFDLTEFDGRQDYALTSLGIALRSYASTAHAIHGELRRTERAQDKEEQRTRDYNLPSRYRDAAFETIIHLQHFAELVVKEALRRDHELLVIIAERQHEQLHDLLHGKEPSDSQKVKTIEASLALQRACALIKAKKLDSRYDFIDVYRPFLETLNTLRNRLWHRGRFVLRYRALDELVGRYALPFIGKAVALDPYAKYENAWKPKTLACGIDPISDIEQELKQPKWSVPKVAFLKEMARAAYENPLYDHPWFEHENRQIQSLVEETVEKLGSAEMGAIERVTSCPVCGMKALIVYEETDEGPGEEGPFCRFTWMAKCEGCTLDLRASYGNPSEYGWKLENYWWQDPPPISSSAP